MMPEFEAQEIYCKTLLNKVTVPDFAFSWTLNPYRGCRYACQYCYARSTHEIGGVDLSAEFDQKVFAKVNAPEVLREELRGPKWQGDPIAIGTASDPYEPAEVHYQLTRKIIKILTEFQNPASINTKGVLVKRDVDVLSDLYRVADVQIVFSIGSVDEAVWKVTEPGAPNPMERLEVMQFLVESGVPAGVMMAPLMPGISDGSVSIEAVVEAAAQHKAKFISGSMLALKPGTKEWFAPLIRQSYPHLVPGYNKLFGGKTYVPRDYSRQVLDLVESARRKWDLPLACPPRELKGPQGQLGMILTV